MHKYTLVPTTLILLVQKQIWKLESVLPPHACQLREKGFLTANVIKIKINQYVSAKSEKDKVLTFNTVAIAPKETQTAILKFPGKYLITGNNVN